MNVSDYIIFFLRVLVSIICGLLLAIIVGFLLFPEISDLCETLLEGIKSEVNVQYNIQEWISKECWK